MDSLQVISVPPPPPPTDSLKAIFRFGFWCLGAFGCFILSAIIWPDYLELFRNLMLISAIFGGGAAFVYVLICVFDKFGEMPWTKSIKEMFGIALVPMGILIVWSSIVSYSDSPQTTQRNLVQNKYSNDSVDYDCDDFDSQADAQDYFENQAVDSDALDGDSDGIACELLK